MKIHISWLLLSASALLLSSCDSYLYSDVGWSGTSTGLYSNNGWSNARYDYDGFPIYGYYDGRPVYGYTAAGVPIYTYSRLDRHCYVPNWNPAPHYRGHYRYPSHVHHCVTPPKRPSYHVPSYRPQPNNRPAYSPSRPSQRPSYTPPSHSSSSSSWHSSGGSSGHSSWDSSNHSSSSSSSSSSNWDRRDNHFGGSSPSPSRYPANSRPR